MTIKPQLFGAKDWLDTSHTDDSCGIIGCRNPWVKIYAWSGAPLFNLSFWKRLRQTLKDPGGQEQINVVLEHQNRSNDIALCQNHMELLNQQIKLLTSEFHFPFQDRVGIRILSEREIHNKPERL